MKLGIDTTDDTFVTIMRTAFYDDTDAATAYFDNVPYRVLRMEMNKTSPGLFQPQPLIERITGRTDATQAGISMEEMREAIAYLGYNVAQTIRSDNHSKRTYDWYLQGHSQLYPVFQITGTNVSDKVGCAWLIVGILSIHSRPIFMHERRSVRTRITPVMALWMVF